MSHFSVLVVTPNGTDEEIDKALLPFHEFECTGWADYVQEIEITQEARETFASQTKTRLRKLDDGSLHDFFDESGCWKQEFSQPDPNETEIPGVPLKRRVRFIPEGYEEFEQPRSETETLAEFVEGYYGIKTVAHGAKPDLEEAHKYGYVQLGADGEVDKVIDRTNPNKKWDWYQVGGRWSNCLTIKPGAESGRTGSRSWTNKDEPPSTAVDVCRKGDYDPEAARQELIEGRRATIAKAFDKLREKNPALTNDAIVAKWQRVVDIYAPLLKTWEDGGQQSRLWDFISEQSPEMKALKDEGIVDLGFGFFSAFPSDVRDPYAWADNPGLPLKTFAFLGEDGVWHERGAMGWFGCVSDEKGTQDWEAEYEKAFNAIPDDRFIAVVDCHI